MPAATRPIRRPRRAVPALAALVALVALAWAPPAPAATLRSGSSTLTVDSQTAKALAFFRVRMASTRPARRRGRAFTLPVSGGSLTTGRAAGTVEHRGGIRFSFGGRSLTMRDLRLSFRGRSITARAGGRRLQFAAVLTDRARASRSGFGTRVTGLRVFLASAGARALNRALRVRGFRRGLSLGRLTVTAQPRDVALDGGASLVVVDGAMASLLSGQGIVLEPVAPTTQSGTAFSSPITGGTLRLSSPRGEVRHDGGLTFIRADQRLSLERLVFDLDATPDVNAAAGSTRASILDLDLDDAQRSRDSRKREIRIRGAVATLTATLATALDQAFATDVFQPGQVFGTVTIRASAR